MRVGRDVVLPFGQGVGPRGLAEVGECVPTEDTPSPCRRREGGTRPRPGPDVPSVRKETPGASGKESGCTDSP